MENRVRLGTAIRERREELGLSKAALARAAEVDPSTITRIEGGDVGVSPALLFLLAWVLEMAPYEFADVAGMHDLAQRWRARGEAWEPANAMRATRQAMGGLPIKPSARAAVLRVIEEFTKAQAPNEEWRQRFDAAWDYATQPIGAKGGAAAFTRETWERRVRERLLRKLFEEPG